MDSENIKETTAALMGCILSPIVIAVQLTIGGMFLWLALFFGAKALHWIVVL